MNKFLLYLVMLPSALWRALGADTRQLKAILKIKLSMDDRKPLAMGRQSQKKPKKNMTWLSMFISGVMGFLYGMSLLLPDRIMALWLYFSMLLFVLTFSLVSDFSTVLFDTRDKHILMPRPVNDRTILLSRLLHILIYMARLVGPMSLPGWIIIGMLAGWKAALWFPLMIVLLTLLALFLVTSCYLIILNVTKASKFKDVINYFQIIFSIIFFLTAYLLPQAYRSDILQQAKHSDFAWAKFTPSYWLAACWTWFNPSANTDHIIWLSIPAVLAPLFFMYVTIKWLAPSFTRKISGIDATEVSSSAETNRPATSKKGRTQGQWSNRLAKIFTHTPAGRAGFMLAWNQTSRSRSFKMRVYPTFAYVPVYFVWILTQSDEPLKDAWASLSGTSKHLVLLYMCSVIIMTLVSMLVYSDQYKASWIYYSAPVEKPGLIMDGALKAMWVKYFLPLFLIVSIFILNVWGPGAALDILLAFCNITFFGLVISRVAFRKLPFSSAEQMNEKSNRFLKTLFVMLVPTALGFGHYIAMPLWWLKLVFLLLSAALLWLSWDSFRNTSWKDVKALEE